MTIFLCIIAVINILFTIGLMCAYAEISSKINEKSDWFKAREVEEKELLKSIEELTQKRTEVLPQPKYADGREFREVLSESIKHQVKKIDEKLEEHGGLVTLNNKTKESIMYGKSKDFMMGVALDYKSRGWEAEIKENDRSTSLKIKVPQ